jgi:hypothetical protein
MSTGYSLGKSQKLPDENKRSKELPGPFNYETSKPSLLGLSTGPKFDPAERKLKFSVKQTDTPGPAAYTTISYHGHGRSDPKISFAKSARSQSMHTLAPARTFFTHILANSYNIKTELDSGK